jgi:hypothetical protein
MPPFAHGTKELSDVARKAKCSNQLAWLESCILDHRLVDMIYLASLSLHTVSRESAAKPGGSQGPAWRFSQVLFPVTIDAGYKDG